MSEKIQDYYQTVTTSPLNIPAPPSLCLCHFCLHPLYSPSWHLTIHQPLASVAPRSQRRGIPWSHSYWSNPSPRPPLTDGGPCHFLLGCCKQKREDNMVQPRMKIQSLPTNPHTDGKSGDYSSSIPFWMFRTKVCGSIHLKTNPMKYYGVFIWCFRWITKLLQLLDTEMLCGRRKISWLYIWFRAHLISLSFFGFPESYSNPEKTAEPGKKMRTGSRTRALGSFVLWGLRQ